jgi:hypothetical protein
VPALSGGKQEYQMRKAEEKRFRRHEDTEVASPDL